MRKSYGAYDQELHALHASTSWIAYWSTCRIVVATTDHDTRRGISHVRLGRI